MSTATSTGRSPSFRKDSIFCSPIFREFEVALFEVMLLTSRLAIEYGNGQLNVGGFVTTGLGSCGPERSELEVPFERLFLLRTPGSL